MGIEEVHRGFWWINLRKRDHLKDLGVDGSIILQWISGSGMGGMDWIDLAQDRDRRRALLNAGMGLQIP
jgi:hypothetical protein